MCLFACGFWPSILNHRLLKVLQLCCLQDLLLAYKEVDLPVFEAIWKHFVQHASQWLSPKNVALSVHAEVPSYTVDAVKEKAFPKNVDIQQALCKRKQLRDFFTEENKFSTCITCFSSPLFLDRQPRRFIYPKDGGRFDAPKMHVFTHLLRQCFTGKSKVRLRPPKSTIYGGSKWPLFTPKTAWIKIA